MDRPAPFGRPGCVTRRAVMGIEEPALKAEAVRLAFESGQTAEQVSAATGFDAEQIAWLLDARHEPVKRGGETI